MDKFRILSKCEYCQGKAYLPEGEAEDYKGRKYIKYKACPHCEGTGLRGKWIELSEFADLLEQDRSTHVHSIQTGSFPLPD